jgi:hypothetical protein
MMMATRCKQFFGDGSQRDVLGKLFSGGNDDIRQGCSRGILLIDSVIAMESFENNSELQRLKAKNQRLKRINVILTIYVLASILIMLYNYAKGT